MTETQKEKVNDKLKYFNTVLLTLISILLLYGVASIKSIQTSQARSNTDIAVVKAMMQSYNEDIDELKLEVHEIKNGNVDATRDRITRSDANKIHDEIKDWANFRFERKK